jgi:hypothetical protein
MTTLATKMGMDLLNIEKQLMNKGYLVLGTHNNGYHYFVVENKEGLQVYCQVNNFKMGYDLSINYKPSQGMGSGHVYQKQVSFNELIETIETAFTDQFTLNHIARQGKPQSIIKKISEALKRKDMLGYRELEILLNVKEVKQNTEVPNQYYIFEVYDHNGNGFEFGKTIHDIGYDEYSITN